MLTRRALAHCYPTVAPPPYPPALKKREEEEFKKRIAARNKANANPDKARLLAEMAADRAEQKAGVLVGHPFTSHFLSRLQQCLCFKLGPHHRRLTV